MDLDVDRAEADIDLLIERRAREAEQASREQQAWAESASRYNMREAAELRREWAEFYRTQIQAAESMRERAAQRLSRLIDEGV